MPAHIPAARRLEPSARTALSRRGVLRGAMALGTASLLGACGSGDVVSAISPSRFIAFGDGLSDVGQAGSRYTVNDGTINIWTEHVANRYGKTLTAQSKGGLGFAQGHGPTEALPRTLSAQIDAFLASNTFQADDVVLINLPMADVLTPVAAVKAGTLTETAALAQVDTNGKARVDDMKRLIAAGAKHIVVCGVYDLSRSPFAIAQNQTGLFSLASLRLNDAFKLAAVNLGANLLFVDAAFLVNRNADDKTGLAFGFANRNTALCTTPTAFSCTDNTLVSTSKSSYLFADSLHLTPNGQQQLGDYAYQQLHARW